MDGPNLPAASGPAPTESERTWGMLAHLSALAGLVVPLVGIVLGPLAVWLVKREESEFVAGHAKEALNFNISVLIGAIKASEGHTYRYPFALRLVN